MATSQSAPTATSPVLPGSPVSERRPLKLGTSPAERQKWDDLANLFGIVKSCELLEKALAHNAIDANGYRKECLQLIDNFKTARKLTQLETNAQLVNFMREYRLESPLAYQRLVVDGVPQHTAPDKEKHLVAATTQHFITLKDSLELNVRSVDGLQPLFIELMDALRRLRMDFNGRDRLEAWVVKLNGLKASDEISEEEARQLKHDLEVSYTSFQTTLQNS